MFGASWCVPCGRTKPAFLKVCEEFGIFGEYIDVDDPDHKSDPALESVSSVPVIRIYDPADSYGQPVVERNGGSTVLHIRQLFEQAQQILEGK
jgi:thiol-disulfide isomerase/thioredoxin